MDKIISIEPIRDDMLDCFERVLITLSKWWGIADYPLLFTGVWNFAYTPQVPNKKRLSDRFNSSLPSDQDAENYLGIFVRENFMSSYDEVWRIVLDELEKGIPPCLPIDPYWIPWNPIYRKLHLNSFLLVVGIDTINGTIQVLDPMFSDKIESLEVNNNIFESICCITFSHKKQKQELDWKTTIQKMVPSQQGNKQSSTTMFDQIRQFADEVELTCSIRDEIDESVLLYKTPFFRKLEFAGHNRLKISVLFQFLYQRLCLQELEEASKRMYTAGTEWGIIEKMFLKAAFLDKSTGTFRRIADRLRELATWEEQTASLIEKLIIQKRV